jgi:hypothetical protein
MLWFTFLGWYSILRNPNSAFEEADFFMDPPVPL